MMGEQDVISSYLTAVCVCVCVCVRVRTHFYILYHSTIKGVDHRL